jgi:hypothetical protein
MSENEGEFLKGELRKMHTAALECIIGHTWGVQSYAFDILVERGEMTSMFPRDESNARRSNVGEPEAASGIYVRKPDMATSSTAPHESGDSSERR